MRGIAGPFQSPCARFLRVRSAFVLPTSRTTIRNASNNAANTSQSPPTTGRDDEPEPRSSSAQGGEMGAFSRRLSQMSEENIEAGGRSAAKAVEEAGFSEDLKKQLEEKILNSKFQSDNASAFAQAGIPASAGRGTRDIAAAQPWSGVESTEDATLRMLTDKYKPLRVPSRGGGPARAPSKVDTGRPRSKPAVGVRLANARDKASSYESIRESGLNDEEREKMRQDMKMKFHPGARATPATITGLQSLANERIEDAIARGQFKNIPRGQKIERDHNASSPFINTTEYLMNKIIQRQEIVPPWIEKQQELVSTATRFRSRLRADWKRYVSRVIASRGGTLESQMRLADEYALAEAQENPVKKKEEKLNAIDESGHVSQITLAGELKPSPPENTTSADIEDAQIENEIQILEQSFNDDGTLKSQPDQTVTISLSEPLPPAACPPANQQFTPRKASVAPFRDPSWENTERAYLSAAVENLNSIARSYNLMAPPIARKPYYYLDRELRSCFADVAPQVAAAIRERALAPQIKGIEMGGTRPGGLLESFGRGDGATVYDERKPQYGFKEFWRDLFRGSKA